MEEGGALEASRREDLSMKRSPGPQERLEELEEKMKGFRGWSQLPEKEKEQWRASTRVGLALLESERPGSGSDDELEDDEGLQASEHHDWWVSVWGHLGSFDATTIIGPVRFVHDTPPPEAAPCTTMQVFSAKIVGLSGGLQFPLDVYGMIVARDCADRRANVIFNRPRNDCQTITEQDPYLVLTGPSRAIVLLDPVFIEVMLKVKGTVECEDKILNFQVAEFRWSDTGLSRMITRHYKSKLSTLDLALGSVDSSVEGYITVRFLDVPLPNVLFITASTTNSNPSSRGSSDIDSKKINLFDSRRTSEPVSPNGFINLSRSVVSARITGKLTVCIETLDEHSKEIIVIDYFHFPARKKDWARVARPFRSGAIEIGVACSLISYHK